MKNKPIIANIHATFFEKSETFIHNYLSNLENFKPVCLALEYKNLDNFPLPKEDLYYFNKRRLLNWPKAMRMRRDGDAQEVLKNLDVKLIHAHFGHNGFHCLNLKRKFGLPLVTTFYDFDASKLPRKKRWRNNYKILFKEGDLFLVEGNHMRLRLIGLGCPPEKIQLQRIAIPLEKISLIPRKRKNSEKTTFIFSGRFVEKKGLIYALKAIDKIKYRYNFEFRIIGDGPLKGAIEKFVNDRNLNSGLVKMLGFLSYDKYLTEMAKADIFIHPSVVAADGDSEGGAPTTILEAQAMGMPVVSTYHSDIPNIVVPGKSALMSKEKDIDSLAENMTFLLENPRKWKSMGETGRQFIAEFHDIKTEVNKLEDKYYSLLYEGMGGA